MNLTEEEQSYKLPIDGGNTKTFFHENDAQNWDLNTYFQLTHNYLNKNKNVHLIYLDYNNDLNWISQLDDVPASIKEYAINLIKKKKPAPALLKANIARAACKKQKLNDNAIVIKNSHIINSGSGSLIISNNGQPIAANKKRDINQVEEEDDNGQQNKEIPSIWKDWAIYINSNIDSFHPFSLEANDVIRAGDGISNRPHLDQELYKKHVSQKCTLRHMIPEAFQKYIIAFITSDDPRKAMKPMSSYLLENDDAAIEFLRDVLLHIQKTYTSHIDHNSSEDAFNQLLVWPFLDILGGSITTANNYGSEALLGQPVLMSMTRQLKSVGLFTDNSNVYKSDGMIKLYNMKQQEILLLETSGCFSNNDKCKINFDHHKGVFGLLSMLKCVADDYQLGSVDTFKKSVCYNEEGIFDLWREASVYLMPDEANKNEFIPKFVQFLWTTKCLVEESITNIITLKQQHDTESIAHAFSLEQRQSLSDIVNPIILKLTKEDDHHGMATLGPIYSPSHP